jgi:Tfp pilus assembly protein PilO
VKRKLSPRALYGVVGAGLLVYALFGWFVLVGPKRAAATSLKQEATTAETRLATARAVLAAAGKDDVQPIAVADIFRLSTAMPSVPDMPGILLELSRIAQETGIEFNSITPGVSEVVGAYQRVPISVSFDGNFYELSDFLFRVRTLVGVRNSELHSAGRLFSVDTINFAESPNGFPELGAILTVSAFVYGTSAPANDVPTAPEAAPAPGTTVPEPSGAEEQTTEASP